MNVEKLSISLPVSLVNFVKEYQSHHHYKTKSEVFQEAIRLLRQKALDEEYLAASKEVDSAFDVTDKDGLEDEAW